MPPTKRRKTASGLAAGRDVTDVAVNTYTQSPQSDYAEILRRANIKTSEDVIKALKSSEWTSNLEDGEPISRTSVAQAAWHAPQTLLFFPKKAEVLGEWTLGSLVKSAKTSQLSVIPLDSPGVKKGRKRKSSASGNSTGNGSGVSELLSSAYWDLLASILNVVEFKPDTTPRNIDRTNSTNLAGSHSVLPFLLSFLTTLQAFLGQDTASVHTENLLELSAMFETPCKTLCCLLQSGNPSLVKASHTAEFDTLQQSSLALMNIEAALLQKAMDTQPHKPWTEGGNEALLLLLKALQSTVVLHDSVLQLWLAALGSGTNRKKAYIYTLSTGLNTLSDLLSLETVPRSSWLIEQPLWSKEIQHVKKFARITFADSILNADVLQHALQRDGTGTHKSSMTLTAVIEAISHVSTTPKDASALHMLWELLPMLVKRLRSKGGFSLRIDRQATVVGDEPQSGITDAVIRTSILHVFIRPVYGDVLQQDPASDRKGVVRPAGMTEKQIVQHLRHLADCVLECELYRAGTPDGAEGWAHILQSLLAGALGRQRGVYQSTTTRLDDIRIVAAVWALDSNLASAMLGPTLEMLLTGPPAAPSDDDSSRAIQVAERAEQLFNLIVSSATRTRSLPDLLQLLSGAIETVLQRLQSQQTDADSAFLSIALSPLFTPHSIRTMRHAVRHSISSLQVVDVLSHVRSRCLAYGAAFVDSLQARGAADAASAAGVLALELDLASHVIAQVDVASVRKEAVLLIRQLLHSTEPQGRGVKDVLKCTLSELTSSSHKPALCLRIVNGALRFLAAVDQLRERLEDDEAFPAIVQPDDSAEVGDGKESSTLKKDLGNFDDILPGLQKLLSAETGLPGDQTWQLCDSTLHLLQMSQNGILPWQHSFEALLSLIMDTLTRLLQDSPDASEGPGPWDGNIHSPTREAIRTSVWGLILRRWAALIDAAAGGEGAVSLTDISGIMLNAITSPNTPSEDAKIVTQVLSSAAFLELPNWRKAILQNVLNDSVAGSKTTQKGQNAHRLSAVTQFPPQYFAGRWDEICQAAVQSQSQSQKTTFHSVQIRTVLVTALRQGARMEASQVLAVLSSITEPTSRALEHETLAILREWVRKYGSASAEGLPAMHAALREKTAMKAKSSALWDHSLIVFQETLLDTLPGYAAKLSEEVAKDEAMEALERTVKQVQNALSCGDEGFDQVQWYLRGAVAKIRQIQSSSTSAKRLSQASVQLCAHMATKLLEEIEGKEQAANTMHSVDVLLPLFHLLRLTDASDGDISVLTPTYARALSCGILDTRLQAVYAESVQNLSAAQYEGHLAWAMQQLQIHAVSAQPALAEGLSEVISVLLIHSPEGSGDIVRKYFQILLGVSISSSSASQRSMLRTVREICQKKTVLLTHQHTELLLFLISGLVSPRNTDVEVRTSHEDSRAIFLDITSTLSILIRQRRDLLVGQLSQLSIILGRMIHLLRAAIPRLGAAQLRTIQRSLPTWLDVEHLPLDETCARALARLLSAITARTITLAIRSRTAADSSDKVDSLAKPFARHAIHVLVAYVRALLSSPSSSALSATFVPSTLQRALEPGLFALCDITNSHDRDAALVGMLDSAGKTIMKRLWSSWEAQRYKGQ